MTEFLARAMYLLERAWRALGVAIGITMFAVLGYVTMSAWRRALPRPGLTTAVVHPNAGEEWFAGYSGEFETSSRVRWSPYVYWRRRPFAGRYINVDSEGFRRSVQASSGPGPHRQVWFFGGSMLWGTWQRDGMTIPSLVAREVARAGLTNVDVRNFGETGFVFTQEVLQLMLQLRAGGRPDVVVFYDGVNDLIASTMTDECGIPQNESRRTFEFTLGRVITTGNTGELTDFLLLLAARVRQRLDDIRVGRGGAPTRQLDVDALATRTVACYASTAGIVEALSRQYGFTALYFWQPMPGATRKPLTAYERTFLATPERDGFHEFLPSLDSVATARIGAVMAPVAAKRFSNLGSLFSGDTTTVWVDFVGHITERANEIAVGRIGPPVIAALRTTSHPVAAER